MGILNKEQIDRFFLNMNLESIYAGDNSVYPKISKQNKYVMQYNLGNDDEDDIAVMGYIPDNLTYRGFDREYNNTDLIYENKFILLYIKNKKADKHKIEIFFFHTPKYENTDNIIFGRIGLDRIDDILENRYKYYAGQMFLSFNLDKIFYTNLYNLNDKNIININNNYTNYCLLSDSIFCMIYQKEINYFLHKVISEYPEDFVNDTLVKCDNIKYVFTYMESHFADIRLLVFRNNKFILYKYINKEQFGTYIYHHNTVPYYNNYDEKYFDISDIRKSINGKLYFNLMPANIRNKYIRIPDSSVYIKDSYNKCNNEYNNECDYETGYIEKLNDSSMGKQHFDDTVDIVDINDYLNTVDIVDGDFINFYTDITDFIKECTLCTNISFKKEKYYYIYGMLFLISNNMLYIVNCNSNIYIKINIKYIKINNNFRCYFDMPPKIIKKFNEHRIYTYLNNFIKMNSNIISEFNKFILSYKT